jgi:hypothetical protein
MAIVLNGATSGNVTINANAISGTSVITLPVGTGTFPLMTLSTAVATTSGTSIDFISIPSWVKKITVMFNGVSTNGSSAVIVQIGSGSIETTGYTATNNLITNGGGVNGASYTSGFGSQYYGATCSRVGHYIITLLGSNTWISTNSLSDATAIQTSHGSGLKTTAGVLDRIRITTVNGTDTFDAGSVNILMEGY